MDDFFFEKGGIFKNAFSKSCVLQKLHIDTKIYITKKSKIK